jgi:periplasmic protein CpxP/Spy
MRTYGTCSAKRAAVAAAIILGFLASAPSGAAAQTEPAKQAPARESVQAAAKQSGNTAKLFTGHKLRNIEESIGSLREELKIAGPAQEQAWDGLAQVMRANTEQMQAKVSAWAKDASRMSAVENLRAHGEMAELHAQSYAKLTAAFEALYNALSPEQKKTADALFATPRHGHGKRAGR